MDNGTKFNLLILNIRDDYFFIYEYEDPPNILEMKKIGFIYKSNEKKKSKLFKPKVIGPFPTLVMTVEYI